MTRTYLTLVRSTRCLIRPGNPKRHKLHAVDCPWAANGNTGTYEERDRSEFPPNHPVCRRCGGA